MSNKFISLEDMTLNHFKNYPEQPVEAIEEYVSYIDIKNKNKLLERFKDNEYYKSFQTALLHTSFMVNVFIAKTLNDVEDNVIQNLDTEQYIREFLFFSRKDDKDIYDMKVYYFTNIDSESVGIGQVSDEDLEDLSKEEKDVVSKNAQNKKEEFNALIQKLKKQYMDSKVHLV